MAASFTSAPRPSHRLARQVAGALLSRLVLNTARRFIYPFAPVFSRGLGVPLTAITSLVAVCQAAPLAGLISGPLSDRLGYRRMMLTGLGALALGMLAVGVRPAYPVLAAGLILASLGKTVFDPAIQAYVGARVPYHRRGLVIGLMEFSWAGSTLVGVPLIGLLIEAVGWRAAPWALGIAAAICLLLVACVFGPDPAAADPGADRRLTTAWRRLLVRRSAVGMLGFAFFISAANDTLFIVYGVWLENAYGLGVAALGLSAGVIGGAELLGEALTAAASDRLGLKRSASLGLLLTAAAYALLPLWGAGLAGALAGLAFIFTAFEFTLVTCLSLSTELLPGQRATMMAGFFAAAGVGRACGALLGVPVWQVGGMEAVGMAAAALTVTALVSLRWGLAGWSAARS